MEITDRGTLSERVAVKKLRENGSKVYKMAWPDLLEVDRNGQMFFTEIKRLGGRLSRRQRASCLKLEELGFNVKIVVVSKDRIDEYPLKNSPQLTTSERKIRTKFDADEVGKRKKGKLLRELEEGVEEMLKERERKPKFVDMFDEIRSKATKRQSGSQSEPESHLLSQNGE